MASESLAELAQDLSSLDHALILSLIANQHCLIETTEDCIDKVGDEIQLIASQLFGLPWIRVDCHQDTTLEDLNRGILVAKDDDEDEKVAETGQSFSNARRTSAYSISKPDSSIEYTIPNIVITKNLHLASRQVQVQALELIRTNRIFTHTAVHASPKPFLLVILNQGANERLDMHLNDMIFISHYHDPQEELPRVETQRESHGAKSRTDPPIPSATIQHLSSMLPSITITSETRSYLMTLTISLRTHRALIPGSATPTATRHLELLSRCLALLHGIDYVSPSLIALATRKVYRHRLRILRPKDASWERSVMYGSKVGDIKDLLEDLWIKEDRSVGNVGEIAEGIIENVVAGVEVPV